MREMGFVISTARLIAYVGIADLVVSIWTGAPVFDHNEPIKSAEEDAITNLPGLNFEPSFKQYSGYLAGDVEKTSKHWIHYWLVESQSTQPDNDPLVLWLNGGDIFCSSLNVLFTEAGPFRVEANGTLSENKFAWNRRANVLFMDSPAGAGLSYSVHQDEVSDDTVARQAFAALGSFFNKFPKYKRSRLYLAGRHWAGVYLPLLAELIVEKEPDINLSGISIGNGFMDEAKQFESFIYYAYYHGLVGEQLWAKLSRFCCNGKTPARGSCNYHLVPEICNDQVVAIGDRVTRDGLNYENINKPCQHQVDMSRLMTDRLMGSRKVIPTTGANDNPTCVDLSLEKKYLNQDNVREALHVLSRSLQTFHPCADFGIYQMIYAAREGGLSSELLRVLNSKHDIKLLVYHGDADAWNSFLGVQWFVEDLNRTLVNQTGPWYLDGQVGGSLTQYQDVTFITIKAAGQQAIQDWPAGLLAVFERYLLQD